MAKKNNPIPQKNLQDLVREYTGVGAFNRTVLPQYFYQALNPAFKLRPYQEECFKYFVNYWDNEDCREIKSAQPQLLFHMATGSGKTLIMAGLMLYLFEKGYRNFLFFVNSTNIIGKTKENFLNQVSVKYLFAPTIEIGGKRIEIRLVDNFQGVTDDSINLCLTTIQGLHLSLNNPHENSLTYDDFADQKIILISDEAHHINSSTKKGKTSSTPDATEIVIDFDGEFSDDWETTVMRIFCSNSQNILLEFTATCDLTDPHIAEKYAGKIIFDYPLKKFREDGYSKDIEVVQSDMQPIDRAMQTVILNQYKRKLFAEIGQDIKPVMMLKSKTIKDNKEFFNLFNDTLKHLITNDLHRISISATGDIAEAFKFFDEKNISLENLLLELKEDFKEENLLLVDGNNISPEKQLILNSLEAKDNEFRAVFAVDMLNEGWDVLNLYDIVRLYDSRDAKENKPGKTTMQEAQLIGRGARYMPFTAPEGDKPQGQRKYDDDISNRLRTVEKLHYHSSYNPRYVAELHTAMVETGIVAEKSRELKLQLKESFKKTKLYRFGYVFVNDKEWHQVNEKINSFGDNILNNTFKVRIRSGEMKSSIVFEQDNSGEIATKTKTYRLGDFGKNILREAINRLEYYKYSTLRELFPALSSINHFIESPYYLAGLHVTISGQEDKIVNLSQRNKLGVTMEVLKQIEHMVEKSAGAERGSKKFTPKAIKDLIKDKVLKISLDGSTDKELGFSMKESSNLDFSTLDLSKCEWYAFDECYGTSEEKHLVRYIDEIYHRLKEKYQEVYLVRNEREVKLYDFKLGRGFEPDYLLFMQHKTDNGKYDNLQIFIEPKGAHLREKDSWKQEFMLQLKSEVDISFSTQTENFHIWGLPFFTDQYRREFDRAIGETFGI